MIIRCIAGWFVYQVISRMVCLSGDKQDGLIISL